jgi:hypothetical protein
MNGLQNKISNSFLREKNETTQLDLNSKVEANL